MAANYEQGLEAAPPSQAGLEAAPQNFPELAYQQPQQQQYQQHQSPYTYVSNHSLGQLPSPYTDSKQTPSTVSFAHHPDVSPYTYHATSHPTHLPPRGKSNKVICGCSLLVFVLSCIIGFLSAAVIGLAAGTGIEAKRANDANAQVIALNASLAALGKPTATATGIPAGTALPAEVIDDGCEADPEGVTGTYYTAFSLLGGLKYTRYCNKDAKFNPLMKLFTSSFSTCMDACASYTKYVSITFGRSDNTTCAAVSFVPAWTDKSIASAGGAPGNCYLKPGPQNLTTLETPNIGVAVHAGVWNPGA
ncbi:hypothetical protein QBC34DRAFT_447998 [Podospora aff. communis PSN243]|uniref:Uncharacterized protein n=1 Tax=Podospora aff. communis PSN243 TaxID=3040156 RepID=A0AAV9GS94_9PEZI|nr:hypothetical protein QBC34DRAFT_447998 [Podospora aff. communis PSN243]